MKFRPLHDRIVKSGGVRFGTALEMQMDMIGPSPRA
jgi:hypothetical protein